MHAVTRFVQPSEGKLREDDHRESGINTGAWRVPADVVPKAEPIAPASDIALSEDTTAAPEANKGFAAIFSPLPERRPVRLVAGVPLPDATRFLIGVEADLGVMLVPGQARPVAFGEPAGIEASAIGTYVLFKPLANGLRVIKDRFFAEPLSRQVRGSADTKPISVPEEIDQALPVAWSRIGESEFAVTGEMNGQVNHWQLALGGFGG